MINPFKLIDRAKKETSVIKRLMNNPDKFIATIEVINDEIIISIKDKTKEAE